MITLGLGLIKRFHAKPGSIGKTDRPATIPGAIRLLLLEDIVQSCANCLAYFAVFKARIGFLNFQ